MSLTLVVLAAGIGSRYGGLKQIAPIGEAGETIIDYSVYDALRTGFDKLVFVIRRDMRESFRETIGRRFERRLKVDYVFQEPDRVPPGFAVPQGRKKPWGTGHALLSAADAVHEPFAAINGDDFYGAESFRILTAHLREATPDHAMVGFVLRNTLSEFGSVARGVCRVTADSFLEGVTELTRVEREGQSAKHTDSRGQVHPLTGDEIVSLNMWGFRPSLFGQVQAHFSVFLKEHAQDEKAEFYIPTVVNSLVAAREARVRVLRTSDSWFGITYREDRARVVAGVRQLIQQGIYPERLWG
jgi:NDP-sugar pyrophosphorylase family protein